MRNDLSIYRTYAPNWWDDSQRFLRLLHNLVPARLKHFDTIVGTWRGRVGLALLHAALMPVYWLAISCAAYLALLQLVTAPYYWEKTEHTAGMKP